MTQKESVLDVPDGCLHYEVRGVSGPLVVLVGAPMGADAFAPLAELLAVDHTVLTTDPRGIHRSPLHDPEQDSTPDLRADDLARLITHLDAGPATILGSSGGAVTALALAQTRPELVRAVIAHEPPLEQLLDDRDELRAHREAMIATYLTGDRVGAWAQFLAGAGIAMPAEVLVAHGEQAEADERRWFAHEMRGTCDWLPDPAALTAAHVVPGIGADSAGQMCDRTTRALAAQLGVEPTVFPGGHAGFVEDPPAFATRLRALLDQRGRAAG
ncbi:MULTISPECIES: alpha/beta hydrolase [unclassified Pseudonocardia]|uniref:alpha/beta fold hydrolase n=1 Tax=unclassified Pseudonocardia TaxID=2619320 RepID=UPI001AD3A638|nr:MULTISPECIES: alpha/beta hydrolase [unclassified Pseudonocardia]MBN9098558.1 alpha/beta hydrolase [Pseudonocardia sp.]